MKPIKIGISSLQEESHSRLDEVERNNERVTVLGLILKF